MDDPLKALLHLQEVDDEIARIEEHLRSLPMRVQAVERELARHREALSALHDDLIDIQKEADERELQLKSGEAHISKLQAQRLGQYRAMTSQFSHAPVVQPDTVKTGETFVGFCFPRQHLQQA